MTRWYQKSNCSTPSVSNSPTSLRSSSTPDYMAEAIRQTHGFHAPLRRSARPGYNDSWHCQGPTPSGVPNGTRPVAAETPQTAAHSFSHAPYNGSGPFDNSKHHRYKDVGCSRQQVSPADDREGSKPSSRLDGGELHTHRGRADRILLPAGLPFFKTPKTPFFRRIPGDREDAPCRAWADDRRSRFPPARLTNGPDSE